MLGFAHFVYWVVFMSRCSTISMSGSSDCHLQFCSLCLKVRVCCGMVFGLVSRTFKCNNKVLHLSPQVKKKITAVWAPTSSYVDQRLIDITQSQRSPFFLFAFYSLYLTLYPQLLENLKSLFKTLRMM